MVFGAWLRLVGLLLASRRQPCLADALVCLVGARLLLDQFLEYEKQFPSMRI